MEKINRNGSKIELKFHCHYGLFN